jgi:hypothetical protein
VAHVECRGYTAGAGWELLQDAELLMRHAGLVSALWLLALLAPAGYWLRGWSGVLSGIGILAIVCAGVPLASGLVVSPPVEWLGAFGGLLGGACLSTVAHRRATLGGDTR